MQVQPISAAYLAVLPPPLSPIASRRNIGTAELFTFGCVHIKIQAPWETGNQRAHYLPQVSYTRVPVQNSSRLTLTSSLSLALLCRSHREVIELHSRLCGYQPPSSEEHYGRRGCVRSVGQLRLRSRGQTNVVAWQGTERLSCVSRVFGERGPLRSAFPLRVFKAS